MSSPEAVIARPIPPVPVRAAAGATLTAQVVDLSWLSARSAAWDRLSAAAADPNPFFSRHLVQAHVGAGLAGTQLRFIAVQSGQELHALAPISAGGASIALHRANTAWTSRFLVVNAAPLVRSERLEQSVEALLDAAASVEASSLWRWPHLALDGPTGRALQEGLRRRGWASDVLASFDRPVLDPRNDYEAYARAHLSPGRRKRLQRTRDRLARQGELECRPFSHGEALAAAVERFLALELASWKGGRGTALASRPETAALARAAFRPYPGPVSVRADVLTLSGTPIAISLALVCGGTAYLLKTAYDQRFRACAPGLILEDEIIRAFHATRFAERLDSASEVGGVLESLYPDRARIGELVFSTDPGFSLTAVQRLLARERSIERLRRAVKRVYWRAVDAGAAWRGRRGPV